MKSVHSALLCLVYTLYLVFGGIIFMFVEYEVMETNHITEPPEWTHLKDLALRDDPPVDEDELLSLAPWLPRACPALTSAAVTALVTRGKLWSQVTAVEEVEATCPHLHQVTVTREVVYEWSFIQALYFSMTVITTIGYGHLYPTTSLSRVVCIVYSLVGIPLTGILLAWTSSFFGDKLLRLFRSRLSEERQQSHSSIAAATVIYIGLGFLVFIFVPAAVFSSLEGWTYLESVYYSYITLTTIGFGDLVSGYEYSGTALHMYHIGVILWIMVGLGYWVMVANFITKALRSKRLKVSMKRSAEEIRKLMQQAGLKNHDPTFLREHTKGTINLMLQVRARCRREQQCYEYSGTALHMYHIGVILWIMVGLGYWVMVANFITKALRSKRLKVSMKRSAEEIRKLMQQAGLKNHDPTFLREHTKGTINLMLQLSNILAIQEVDSGEANGLKNDFSDASKPTSPGPSHTPTSPLISGGIPGISSMFGAGLSKITPITHLMGPLGKEDHGETMFTEEYSKFNRSYNPPPKPCKTPKEYSVNVTGEAGDGHCNDAYPTAKTEEVDIKNNDQQES
ncbi:Open rectifier potassium channel protein 1 [Chionoecetes opilio]|uniref:Open rectifier potassium channel protein 1 n=1 Tax=Chionoecetes opilio TaxID=41210 RepID=A0A8J5CM10_CHIOP|nr:Open rectifier potassium channel protein 1 [Chionoecetes opilio]